jgi:hypothetical protein
VERGISLNAGVLNAAASMWLRPGSIAYAGGTGSLGLLGQAQLYNEGAFLTGQPQLTVYNTAGQTAGLHGVGGIFGLGCIFKNGDGALRLHCPVQAACLGTDFNSTTDLNGWTLTLDGSYPGFWESAKFASGSLLKGGGGTLKTTGGVRNDGMTVDNVPLLEINPPAAGLAILSGEPITGFPLIRLTGAGQLAMNTDVTTARAEALAGMWTPGASKLTVGNGILAGGGGFGSAGSTLDSAIIIQNGDIDVVLPGGYINVPQLCLESAGLTRLMGDGDPAATIIRKTGTGTLDLRGRTLGVSEFHFADGLIHDSLTGGMILHAFLGPIPNRFYMTGGTLDARVEGSPDWFKNSLITTTTLRGFLEDNGDDFDVNEGVLRLELTAPEDFNVGNLYVKPTAILAGRARLWDGSATVERGGRLRPDPVPGALSFGGLYLENECLLEVPAIAGAAPIVVPPDDYLNIASYDPAECIRVQITGTPVVGQSYNVFTWAGAAMDGPPPLAQFQLFNSPPGYLQLNATKDTLQFVATASTGYDTWKAANFTAAEQADASISGPHADPDLDGMDNLLEYALGALPKTADAAGRFDTTTTTWRGYEVLACRFTLRRAAADVIIEPEHATTLASWLPAFLEPTGNKTATTGEYLAWIPRDGPRRQFRVRFRRG